MHHMYMSLVVFFALETSITSLKEHYKCALIYTCLALSVGPNMPLSNLWRQRSQWSIGSALSLAPGCLSNRWLNSMALPTAKSCSNFTCRRKRGRKRWRRKKHNWLRWVELGVAKKVPPRFHSPVKMSRIEGQESERGFGIPWLGCRNVVGVRVSTCVRANAGHEIRHRRTAGEYVVQNLVDLC